MSFQKNQHRYFDLMIHFVEGQLSGPLFVTKYMELWRSDRDADYEIKKSWNVPYDEMLVASLKKGEITKEEFTTKWKALWGLSEMHQLTRNLLDEIFTACDVFNLDSVSREDYQYSEDELRTFVKHILSRIKELTWKIPLWKRYEKQGKLMRD